MGKRDRAIPRSHRGIPANMILATDAPARHRSTESLSVLDTPFSVFGTTRSRRGVFPQALAPKTPGRESDSEADVGGDGGKEAERGAEAAYDEPLKQAHRVLAELQELFNVGR